MDSVSWLQNGYELVSTRDGSPTLRALLSAGAEDMHHSGGAWSETRQIYGRLIAPAFEALEDPRFLSLGLGLGYNETLIAQHALKFKKPWSCVSYESDPVLIQAFKLALEDRHPAGEIQETYARIFGAIEEPVKDELLGALAEGRWILEGALTPGGRPVPPFQVDAYLWDAFSQRTSPGLWEEPFLLEFFASSASRGWCGLSSYACVGSLKRALKACGFNVESLEGFHGKRNSTLAFRQP